MKEDSLMRNAFGRGSRLAAAAATGVIAVAGVTLAASWAGAAKAATTSAGPETSGGYSFTTLDNQKDTTFNQLLGISNADTIAGYFGSGAAGHPNKGYLLFPPFGQANYVNENYPGSTQTQITGLNDHGIKVGFFSTMNNTNLVNDNFGFWQQSGKYHKVTFPAGSEASPHVEQLLGVNDTGTAVGFYNDAAGNAHGYAYNTVTGHFKAITVAGATSLTASGINNHGAVAGFETNAGGATVAFLQLHSGKVYTLAVKGASATQAFGVNDGNEVVGSYTVGSGSTAAMHGFTWTPTGGFVTVDDPNGVGATTLNGINHAGDLVGFYTDSAGNTDGVLATPLRKTTVNLNLTAMPQGTVTTAAYHSKYHVTVNVYGLTPGSAHTVLLKGSPIGSVTASGTGQVLATLTVNSIPSGSKVKILNAGVGSSVIAQTGSFSGKGTHKLYAIEGSFPQGSLSGKATLVYDPMAQTISVTVTASGLTPGAHAAHIHNGSCQSHGGVQYMLMDFTADANGNIKNQTQTVSGTTTPLPATGWYLNLHQGNSQNILSNGQPTIHFRPLLCANINVP
jgi:Cu/Zn superoxide dismutase